MEAVELALFVERQGQRTQLAHAVLAAGLADRTVRTRLVEDVLRNSRLEQHRLAVVHFAEAPACASVADPAAGAVVVVGGGVSRVERLGKLHAHNVFAGAPGTQSSSGAHSLVGRVGRGGRLGAAAHHHLAPAHLAYIADVADAVCACVG
eukprot:SAG22_NODE_48_length_24654_cov_4.406394_8_plen_150_part_00